MGKDTHSTSTGITRENEPVITNELKGIALKANPAQPLGRQAASSVRKIFKKQANKQKP